MTATRAELVERLLEHCGHVCVTGDEGPIADAVADRYRELGEPVTRVGNSVVVGEPSGEARPLVLLVGHLDVVPPTDDDLQPRVESRPDGDVVVGRGTSDMKAGNVIAMACFEDPELRAGSPYDLALVLYAGEEGPAEDNELADVLAEVSWLREAALAVILEPTDGQVQAGCLGGLHALVRFTGRQAHSARPWQGENALTKAGAFLAELHELAPREVDVDGITYRDVWSATQAHTDNARNIVPGEFTVNLNFRFAPSRGLDEAEAELRTFVGDRAEVEIIDRAPPAPPSLTTEVLERFVEVVEAPLRAQQSWTDIARFAEVGVPGVNYGPGVTSQSHQRGEFVPVDALVAGYDNLRRFLVG